MAELRESRSGLANLSTPLEYLRAQVWSNLLLRRVYPQSAYQLARTIDGSTYRKSRWLNYLKGASRALEHAEEDPVEAAEAKFPGSAQPFDSAIWHILDGGKISVEECYGETALLGPDMQFVFLSGKGTHNYEAGLEPRDLGQVASLLIEFPTFDALQSLILLLAMADAVEDMHFRNDVCELYHFMVPLFIERGDIPCHEKMFEAIDRISKYRVRVALNQIYEVDHPWQAIALPVGPIPSFTIPSKTPRLDNPYLRKDIRKKLTGRD